MFMNMKIRSIVAITALVLGTATFAKADKLSITGSDNYTSTTINFVGAGSVGGTSTGIFAGFLDCYGCVDLTSSPITYAGAPFTPTEIYTISDNGNTATLTLDDINTVDGNLEIIGDATLVVNGTTYLGILDLTTQQGPADGVTFSATTSVAPEPASLALFGTGLIGIVGIARRKLKV
jgi:hypothetical protein